MTTITASTPVGVNEFIPSGHRLFEHLVKAVAALDRIPSTHTSWSDGISTARFSEPLSDLGTQHLLAAFNKVGLQVIPE